MNVEKIFKEGRDKWTAGLKGDFELYSQMSRIEPGDLVMETSMGKILGSSHIGFLLAIDYNAGNTCYWILNCSSKKVVCWENCKFVSIPNQFLHKYPEYKSLAAARCKKLDNKNIKQFLKYMGYVALGITTHYAWTIATL